MQAITVRRTLHEATGISDREESDIRSNFPRSPFRKLHEYDLMIKREELMASLAIVKGWDEYLKLRGQIEGLEMAVGILNRNG